MNSRFYSFMFSMCMLTGSSVVCAAVPAETVNNHTEGGIAEAKAKIATLKHELAGLKQQKQALQSATANPSLGTEIYRDCKSIPKTLCYIAGQIAIVSTQIVALTLAVLSAVVVSTHHPSYYNYPYYPYYYHSPSLLDWLACHVRSPNWSWLVC